MATNNKQQKKTAKRKAAADAEPPTADMDLSVDELATPLPAVIAPTATETMTKAADMLKEMQNTMESMRQTQSTVSQQLNDFGLRIDQGGVGDYTWKKPGLQKQHAVAFSILQHVVNAKAAATQGSATQAQTYMDNAIKLLVHRLNCIKIADSSPAGWDTVNEYVSSQLAASEEDDKRIKRAEKIAMDRYKERQEAKRSGGRSFSYGGRGRGYGYNRGDRHDNPTEADPERASYRTFGNSRGTSYRSPPTALPTDSTYSRESKGGDTCFHCGEKGHWADKCPRRTYPNNKYCKYLIGLSRAHV